MRTVIAFHAHPDDEVLFTGGTLAKLAAEGHRVVVVVACDGAMGPSDGIRLAELHASARVLGAARVVHLGYADSGHGPLLYPDPPDRARFVRAAPEEAAQRLVEVIEAEQADLLLGYDPAGGYGHRDHVRVHEVGLLAARWTGVRLLEATLPREVAVRVGRVLRRPDWATGFTPRAEITHRVDVRAFARAKRDALAAHRTPLTGSGRMSAVWRRLVRLPVPVFGLLAGREYFRERTTRVR
ncbi:LmbE family N-acetylglucosaminyl deacetylase [Crossiella equi]|uniref:LmbE family N-acetylglucosaminyl deacetylase n=1 Tax=Crossiella equi TaxID=130796 RepID=A0ABS5A5B3_9PSEU|nr:PIG-L deacetylase family protein [Crossiella equi]MBP2471429.1 LmbE family N-acetylglucosaminyl deacetylase [Crossiella equi]